MIRLTEAIERLCGREEVGSAVRLLVRSADEAARTAKEVLLQGVIEREVTRYLGKRRAGRPRPMLTPWRCRQCGPRLGSELRRNGHYLRRPLACEGVMTLRIPQLRCLA